MRSSLAALSIAATLGLVACGGTATHHRTQVSASSAALTVSQGASICNDLNSWLVQAWNQGAPRFSATMTADESNAGSSNLGTDLQTLDSNLQSLNSAALMPSPPGYSPPTGLGALQQDCTAYGVAVRQPGS
jgi:hypothetical protein